MMSYFHVVYVFILGVTQSEVSNVSEMGPIGKTNHVHATGAGGVYQWRYVEYQLVTNSNHPKHPIFNLETLDRKNKVGKVELIL